MAKTKIIQPEKEIPTEVLAASIKEIADGMRKIRAGKLNERALLVLLHDATGIRIPAIREVLEGLENLDKRYLNTKQTGKFNTWHQPERVTND